jgi:chemotaxis family two-component system response regulator Rcp1
MTGGQTEEVSMLLVEDSPADVYLVREIMEGEGLRFQLKVATDGEAAIRMLDQLDEGTDSDVPTLLLLDVNVPRKSGPQVLERLRRSPRCGGIPVVMMSSSDSAADRQRALDLGATEYFCKPSTLKEFMQLGKIIRRLHEASRKAA